jgi:hypothetical protein
MVRLVMPGTSPAMTKSSAVQPSYRLLSLIGSDEIRTEALMFDAFSFTRIGVHFARKTLYLFDFRFLAVFFFAAFFGTFVPSALASESAMAIACLRLLTFRPERPLLRVPALRFFIARPTLADAFFEYFRAMIVLPVTRKQSSHLGKVPFRTRAWTRYSFGV